MENLVGKEERNSIQGKKNRCRLIFATLSLLLVFACDSSSKKNLEVVAYDFTREVYKDSTQRWGSFPEDRKLLNYHWKKNPGRYSQLSPKEKWWNTQMTFHIDSNLFINDSQDSLLFPPSVEHKSSGLKFTFPVGSFKFQGMIGILSDGNKATGQLNIRSGNTLLETWNLDSSHTESWTKIELLLDESSDIEMEWISHDSYLIIGQPLLYKQEITKYPNVILIVIDSARKDFLPFYGFPHNITPHMNALREESILFENPFSNGNWTKPSMISFFYSEYASNLGIHNLWFATLPSHKKIFYQTKIPSIAEAYRQNGYTTESVMNNVFLLDYTTVGVDLGFHRSYQIGKDIEDTEPLTNRAIQFVRENAGKQFFLHFNLNTPHGGYAPPVEYLQKVREIMGDKDFFTYNSPIRRYMGELYYTDYEIGRLIDEMKKQGIYEDSIIIVTGDHGELFDPAHDSHYRYILQGLYGHGETHYDEELNVPYMIKIPNHQRVNKNLISGQSSLLSLAPTLLELSGIDTSSFGYKGVDYSKCILNNVDCPKEQFIYSEGRMSESIRNKDYKYIKRYQGYTMISRGDGEKYPMPEELYDLKKDPLEHNNLSLVPEAQPLLNRARKELQETVFLKKNRFHIHIPSCNAPCSYSGTATIPAGIYKVETSPGVIVTANSSKNFTWKTKGGANPHRITIHTTNPEPEWIGSIYRDGRQLDIRFGKWGIEKRDPKIQRESAFLFAGREPLGFRESTIPWIYNDGRLSGVESTEIQSAMGEEVRKILESWGYIHE